MASMTAARLQATAPPDHVSLCQSTRTAYIIFIHIAMSYVALTTGFSIFLQVKGHRGTSFSCGRQRKILNAFHVRLCREVIVIAI